MIFRETINAAIAWFVKARRISVVRLCFPVEAARLADKSEEIQTANNRSAEYGNQQVGKWGWADKLDGELRLSTWLWILTCEEPRNTQFLEEPGKVASEGFFYRTLSFIISGDGPLCWWRMPISGKFTISSLWETCHFHQQVDTNTFHHLD